jgi:hypothetical protein
MQTPARRYAQAWDAAGGLLMSFTIANLDPWNAVELGALSLPLVFQVLVHCITAAGMPMDYSCLSMLPDLALTALPSGKVVRACIWGGRRAAGMG